MQHGARDSVSHRHDPVTQPDRGRTAQPTPPTLHLQSTVTPYNLVRVCRNFGVSVVCTFTVEVTSDLFETPMHGVLTRCTKIRHNRRRDTTAKAAAWATPRRNRRHQSRRRGTCSVIYWSRERERERRYFKRAGGGGGCCFVRRLTGCVRSSFWYCMTGSGG